MTKTKTFMFLITLILAGLLQPNFQPSWFAAASLSTPQELVDENELPIADFAVPEPANLEKKALRRLKNKRRDIRNEKVDVKQFVLREDSAPVHLQLQSSHAPAEPEFPIAQTDAIVTGEITDAHAYLSNDKTSVYSEFTLRLNKVLRNGSAAALNSGMLITTERPGGRVRFPSGRILLRGGLYGRKMPRIGRQYVLFLSYNAEGQDFSIVTGYELRTGFVFPLDGIPAGENQSLQFANYERHKGQDESAFLAELRQVIVNFEKKQRGQR